VDRRKVSRRNAGRRGRASLVNRRNGGNRSRRKVITKKKSKRKKTKQAEGMQAGRK
jgi:hypothetical protein